MSADRPTEWGVLLGPISAPRTWIGDARRWVSAGFGVMSVPDHFDGTPGPVAAVACVGHAVRPRRAGTLVAAAHAWHPATLLREFETLSVTLPVALELGIGMGWMGGDLAALGTDPAPGPRLARFEELVVAAETWRREQVAAGSDVRLLVGGGHPAVLQLAAEVADVVSINPRLGPSGPADPDRAWGLAAFLRRLEHATDGPRRPIVNVLVTELSITAASDARAAACSVAAGRGIAPATVESSPYFLVGDLAAVRAKVQDLAELGVTYLTVFSGHADAAAGVIGSPER